MESQSKAVGSGLWPAAEDCGYTKWIPGDWMNENEAKAAPEQLHCCVCSVFIQLFFQMLLALH